MDPLKPFDGKAAGIYVNGIVKMSDIFRRFADKLDDPAFDVGTDKLHLHESCLPKTSEDIFLKIVNAILDWCEVNGYDVQRDCPFVPLRPRDMKGTSNEQAKEQDG